MWTLLIVTYAIFLPSLIGGGLQELRKRRMLKRRFEPWDGNLPE